MVSRTLPKCVILIGALSACPIQRGPATPATGVPPATPSEFFTMLEIAFFERQAECTPFYQYPQGPGSDGKRLDDAFAAGKLEYDEAQAQLCLETVRVLPCDDKRVPAQLEQCRAMTGQVATGGACYSSAECKGGWCDTRLSCPGECVALSMEGEACSNAIERCGEGLFCGRDGMCHPSKHDGQPCAEDFECQGILICTSGICAEERPPTEGQACGHCSQGLFCDYPGDRLFASANKAGACRSLPAPAVGDPCGLNQGCGELACKGYSPTTPGTCANWASLDEPCLEFPDGSGVTGCLHGLACIDGSCQQLPTLGPCYSDAFVTDACRPHMSACRDGECLIRKRYSQTCPPQSQCMARNCNDAFCSATGICAR